MTEPLLDIKNLHVSFKNQEDWFHAVRGVSVRVNESQGIAIIGESGSGKTLTMLSVLGLVSGYPGVVDGQITFHQQGEPLKLLHGVDDIFLHRQQWHLKKRNYVERWNQEYLRRAQTLAGKSIGIIFQNPIASLDPLWSVGASITESIKLRSPELTRKEVHEEALEWLARVHIKNPKNVMKSYPHQLSGGMCQRVMIACTLALRPKLIIADEPTTGLDMTTKAQIIELLLEAREKYQSSLVFVTHEIGLITNITEEVYVMHRGKIVDYFDTEKLNRIQFRQDGFELPEDFADYTKELLHHSLRLEFSSYQRQGKKDQDARWGET